MLTVPWWLWALSPKPCWSRSEQNTQGTNRWLQLPYSAELLPPGCAPSCCRHSSGWSQLFCVYICISQLNACRLQGIRGLGQHPAETGGRLSLLGPLEKIMCCGFFKWVVLKGKQVPWDASWTSIAVKRRNFFCRGIGMYGHHHSVKIPLPALCAHSTAAGSEWCVKVAPGDRPRSWNTLSSRAAVKNMSALSQADEISSGSLVMVNSKGMVLEQIQGHLLAFQCSCCGPGAPEDVKVWLWVSDPQRIQLMLFAS